MAAGIALADSQGLEAVSLPRVARALRRPASALHRHVPGTDELVALMVDGALGRPPPPHPGDWRQRLEAWARALEAAFRRHPWCLEATDGLRLMGPNELGWLEVGLSAFEGTPLTPRQRNAACLLVLGQVRTAVRLTTRPDALSARAWELVARRLLQARGAPAPQLEALLESRRHPDDAGFALACILDGLAARMGEGRG